jgi:hypothetical protein
MLAPLRPHFPGKIAREPFLSFKVIGMTGNEPGGVVMRALLLTFVMFSTSALAAAPLPPGKPAGVQSASTTSPGYLLLGAAVVGAAVFATAFNFGAASSTATGSP